jgi:dTDP-4-dehydrorhamnose 3,5-epimerase
LLWSSFIYKDLQSFLPKGIKFHHDKFSLSKKNVIRGIHGDSKTWKIVTCISGEINQVVVDLRKGSKTYLKYFKINLNENNKKLLIIPPKMGNAFSVLSSNAIYHYKLAYRGEYYDVNQQFSLKWNDERIGIKWQVKNPILSVRDR